MFKTASQFDSKSKPVINRFSADDYEPRRLALNYQPPMIILEYKTKSTGKLYHRRMKIQTWNEKTEPVKVLECIKKRYGKYFANGKIKDDQLLRIIEKLKIGCFKGQSKAINGINNDPIVSKKSRQESITKMADVKLEGRGIENDKMNQSPIISMHEKSVEKLLTNKEKTPTKKNEVKLPDLSPAKQIQKSQTPTPPSKTPIPTPKPIVSQQLKELPISRSEPQPEYSIIDDFESIDDQPDCDFDDIPDDESEKPIKREKSEAELSNIDDINSSQVDLNKFGAKTVNKAKELMDEDFRKRQIGKDDENFEYDKRAEFEPDESNEWDVELDDF